MAGGKGPALKDLPVQNLPIPDPEDDSWPTGRAFLGCLTAFLMKNSDF